MTAVRPGAGLEVHLRNVVHLYPTPEGDVVALRGVDLDVAAGETVAILGPSGAGKSTIMALLAGLFPPSAGTVVVGAEDVGAMSASRLAALRALDVSLVVQGPERNLIPYASVAENIWFAQQGAARRGRTPDMDPRELAAALGLASVADAPVERLPAGQRQLAAVAAGVGMRPGLLLLDEPTNRLDAPSRDAVIGMVAGVGAELGMTVVIVTHDPLVAARVGRTVTIHDGRVGREGRRGVEYAVVGRTGLLQLPEDVLDVLPPNSLVEVVRGPDGVELRPAREEP